MARATALVVGLAMAVVLAPAARAAAPNYILVSGHGLTRPVVLANRDENLALLLALTGARRATGASTRELARRPRLDLAEFWGWSGLPRPTSATKTEHHQRFYPAHGPQPAIIMRVVNGVTFPPRLVPANALEILAQHGVPVRL